MKCCYVCKHYHHRVPGSDLTMCPQFNANPLSEEVAKTPESLKLLKCPKTTSQGGNSKASFQRATITPGNLPHDPQHLCCPILAVLYNTRALEAFRLHGPLKSITYKLSGLTVNFCPGCGNKLQTQAAVEERMSKLRGKAKDGKSRRGRREAFLEREAKLEKEREELYKQATDSKEEDPIVKQIVENVHGEEEARDTSYNSS